MKKSIVLTLMLALILSLTSTVFAVVADRELGVTMAVTPASPTEVKKGDTVTATVTFEQEPVSTGRFSLRYDPAVLKLEDYSGLTVEVNTEGAMGFNWLGSEKKTLTFTFTAVGESEDGKSYVEFVPGELVAKDEAELVATTQRVEFTVTKKAAEVTPQPQEPEQQQPNTEPEGPATSEPQEENNEATPAGKPTKMPQAGVNYAVVGGIVIALAALVVVGKKM